MILGDTLATVSQQELVDAGGTVLPVIQPVQTDFRYTPGAREYDHIDPNRLRRHMAADNSRTVLILDRLIPALLEGHTCIALGSSLDMLARLEQAWPPTNGCRRPASFAAASTAAPAPPPGPRRCANCATRQARCAACWPPTSWPKKGSTSRVPTACFWCSRCGTPCHPAGRGPRHAPAPGKTDALVYDFVDVWSPTATASGPPAKPYTAN